MLRPGLSLACDFARHTARNPVPDCLEGIRFGGSGEGVWGQSRNVLISGYRAGPARTIASFRISLTVFNKSGGQLDAIRRYDWSELRSTNSLQGEHQMKKIMVLMLGLGIVLSTAAVAFSQDTTKKESTSKNKGKTKKAKKTTEEKK
jgi:hypothetical protein